MSETPKPDFEGFVREMFADGERGDWDGGTVQDVAEKHGVLIRTTVTERCDPEHCVCAEYGDFPLECFRLAPLVTPPAARGDEERDWREDFGHENGQYQCKCGTCGNVFVGHKRRVTCRVCASPSSSGPGSGR